MLRQPKPVYPEGASQGQRQGNVNLIGRIDAKGKVQDIRLVGATLEAFIDPAVAAVNAWELKPATRGGKPVEIAANIALRYRLEGAKNGVIPSPMLGDLAVFPADIKGKITAPDGFPTPPTRRRTCRFGGMRTRTPSPCRGSARWSGSSCWRTPWTCRRSATR